jgi:hypothetical protein
MHGILLALALAASLLAPSSPLVRLWDPASTTLQKAGPGLDPFGITATTPPAEGGPGLDPNGRS